MFNYTHHLDSVRKHRFAELDSLRGLAALSVVIFHFSINHNKQLLGWEFSYGVTAVDLFFMISGFVIFQSMENTKIWQDFVVKRFARLYPAFWYCMLITAFVAVLVEPHNINPTRILANATMAAAYFGIEDLDGSYWTLLVELVFYVWILAVFISHKLKSVEKIGALTIVAIIAFHFFSGYYLSFYAFATKKVQLLNHFPLFYSGILFFRLNAGKNIRQNLLLMIFSLAAAFYLHDKGGTAQYHTSFVGHCIAITLFHIIFALFLTGNLKFINHRPLFFLGKISYCLYLIHQYVGLQLMLKLTNNFGWNIYPALVLTVGLCILVAHLITRFIEVPCYDLVRNWYEQMRKPVYRQQDQDLVVH